jgi:glutathione S-transferase
MSARIALVSHALCPYVQRAAIVLAEKGIPFERLDIDLAHKPDWFLQVSPLGKTPVLLVGETAVFESAVICEYLDETTQPRLHPEHALLRARHRGWMEFCSALLNTIGGFYNASDETALQNRADDIRSRFAHLELELGAGPFFAGAEFCMVDAVFGPVFRYFDVFEDFTDFDFFRALPKVAAWRVALAARDSVQHAAHPDYEKLLRDFLVARQSALSRHMLIHRPG